MNTDDLRNLSDAEFGDELSGSYQYRPNFLPFLEPELLDRTIIFLNVLRDSLDLQLLKHGTGEGVDENWKGRITYTREKVSSRLHEAQGRRRAMRDSLHGSASAKEWRLVLHKLVQATLDDEEEYGEFPELDEVRIPGGELTLRQWYARRIEKDPSRLELAA